MGHKTFTGRFSVCALFLIATSSFYARAQATRNLVSQPVDVRQLVTVSGNMHPAARPENDQGIVDDSMPIEHVIMMLKRTPEQQQTLAALIDQLHNPKSASYHQWLTPEEFGRQFGPSDSDLATLTDWMETQGFTVEEVAPGRNLLIFSGNAGQVRAAFHTELHHYGVNGEQHYANSSEPQVPAALAPLIAGFRSLHDFRARPLKRDAGVARHNMKTGEWEKDSGPLSVPELTFTYSSKQYFFVSPQDFYTIYNENPLFGTTPKIDGHGVTIAVIEETNVASTSDVTSFRQQFGLPAYPATPNSTDGGVNWMIGPGHGCSTVGVTSTDEEGEALLDVEWEGAVAPKAIVDFVACSGANGIDLSAQYVTNYLASTVVATSLSYGACEISGGSSGATFYRTEWEQEAAEGITPVVSSGDSGSLGCDQNFATGTHNLSVSEMSDTPYNISAGGTDFSDYYQAGKYSTYWSTTNSTVPNGSSALSYIPEITWGSLCANTLFVSYLQSVGDTTYGSTYTPEAVCNSTNAKPNNNDLVAPTGGGGGVSAYNNLPSWQSVYGVGLTGNQTSTTLRNQPDISFFASSGWWGHALVYCQSDTGFTCDYSATGNDSNAYNLAAGGTSFVAPQMGGLMALVVQKTGTRQGVANYTLYNLANLEYGSPGSPNSSNLAACSGSGQAGTSVGAGCIFRDIAGDTPNPWQGGTLTSDIVQPCVWSSVQNCYRSSTHTYGLSSLGNHPATNSPAYPASQGYDAATGLGSPNIANLVNNWTTATPLLASTTTISANPTSLPAGGSTVLTATVTASGRGETATAGPPAVGTVNFYIGSTSGTLLGSGALTQACTGTAPSNLVCPPSTATLTVQGTSLATGANSLIAYFPGDAANDAPATSSAISVGVGAPIAGASPPSLTFGNQNQGTTSASQPVTLSNTGNVALAISGIVASANFGETDNCNGSLAANGSCTINVTFSPTATGPLSGTLTITDNNNDAAGSTQTVSLSGTGIAPAVSLSASSLTFASQPKGTTSAAQSVTITNSGAANLIISTAALGGANAGDFAKSSDTCTGATLLPNGTCSVNVKFAPTAIGSRSASLVFTDNAVNSPQTVTLSGTGAAPTLVSIAVTPANVSLSAGATQQFTATGTYTDNSTQNLTSTVTWSSTNTAAATIASGGLATGVAAGSTTIQATSGGISGSTSLTVTAVADGPSVNPTWSETGNKVDMAEAVAAFVASGTPTLVGHAEAGSASLATTAGMNTTGATLLVAWVAEYQADPAGFYDSMGNIWQALPVYSDGVTHGRFYYAYNPTVGAGHTFSLSGRYPAIAVSAWKGMVATSAVYQGSTGAVNSSTTSLATGVLSLSGAVLVMTGWTSNGAYPPGIAVNSGFTILGTVSGASSVDLQDAYFVSGSAATLVSLAVTPANGSLMAGATQPFTATGTYSDGGTLNLTSSVTWSSTNTAAATITSGGLATAVAAGSTTIQATSGGINGSTNLTVTAAGGGSSVNPTWSETGSNVDMAEAVAAFVASGTPTLVGHAEAGSASLATTAGMNTTGATLLVAWVAEYQADPAGFYDSMGNIWQALPVYSDGVTHGRFYYAYNPTVGAGHTFSLSGRYPAIAVSAWKGMVATSAVYQGSTGAINSSTTSLATGVLSLSGAVLVMTGWTSNGAYPPGIAVNSGFTILGTVSGASSVDLQDAYFVSGSAATLMSLAVTPANGSLMAGATQQFTATGTFSDGGTLNLTSSVTWSSTNAAAATITTGGVATALAAGSTTIQATSGGISGTTSLTVTAAGGGSSVNPTWSETGKNVDMADAVAAFVASATPTLVGHAEAGNTSLATTAGMNTAGATLLVAWVAEYQADPSGFYDSKGNTWQALPVYSDGVTHGRFYYAYNPAVGAGHTFSLPGRYPAIAVSAWSGMVTTSAVYQGSTGATNASTAALATGVLSLSGPVLVISGWASNGTYPSGIAVNSGFTILGSVNGASSVDLQHAYFVTGVSSGPLAITTTTCPGGTQGAAYAGCTIVASGGSPPYTFSVAVNPNVPPLPEGMSINATTGAISSSLIGGQGTYTPEFVVTDSTSAQATQNISIAINGNNAFLANIFPSTSIFHHRVDAATTSLPVDTSPAAPMYSGYLSATVKPFFGNNSAGPFPNGIPAIEVPYNQADVAVSTTVYQSYFTSGPIPAYAPVEGTSNSTGDRHVLVYLEAGPSSVPALYEMWQGIYENGPWTDSSNALWPNVSLNDLTPQGMGTSDAAGLPVAPLLANADEVIGTGTPTSPNGTIQHPIRFTLNHMLNYWVWPATETAGVGSCTATGGGSIPVESEISQSSPPASCTMSGAAGEIYRLKASVATPACAATSPQAAIIITAFRNYGIILADNGSSGGLIGTPDARWNDNDLGCLRNLILSDFEPVNVSSLIVSNGSGATSH